AELVVQMGAGGPAGGADVADQLALFDLAAFFEPFGEAALVGIKGGILAVVLQDDDIAVAALSADEGHRAVGGGVYGCAGRGGVIDALVVTVSAVDRVLAAAEGGADAGELQSRAQEGAAHAAAAEGIVAARSLRGLE